MGQTGRDRAYQHIRRKLAEGVFPVGMRLSPAALAREIGVSHTPVREAISQLQSEGLIIYRAHRGAFVKGPDRQDLLDLIEVRTVLECHAAAMAARRISAGQLQELREQRDALCRLAEAFRVPPGSDLHELLTEWLAVDLAFHMVLLRAAGNRRVISVVEETHVVKQMFGYHSEPPEARTDPAEYAAKNLRVHEDIYEAVRQRDPKAARHAMAAHMRRSRKNLMTGFDWRRRQGDLDGVLVGDVSVDTEIPPQHSAAQSGGRGGASRPSVQKGENQRGVTIP